MRNNKTVLQTLFHSSIGPVVVECKIQSTLNKEREGKSLGNDR